MELDADTLNDLLARWPVARLATTSPAGFPHVLPVVFVAVDGQVCTPLDGKRKDGRPLARVRNIQAHGHASLLLDHYDDDWTGLWWVRLDGPAWIEDGDRGLLEHVAERLRTKYPQYRDVEPYAGTPTLVAMRWQRVAAWTQSGDVAPIRRALSS